MKKGNMQNTGRGPGINEQEMKTGGEIIDGDVESIENVPHTDDSKG
jgi:hypothetical protein